MHDDVFFVRFLIKELHELTGLILSGEIIANKKRINELMELKSEISGMMAPYDTYIKGQEPDLLSMHLDTERNLMNLLSMIDQVMT